MKIKIFSTFSIIYLVHQHVVPIIGFGDEFMSCDRYFENRREARVLEQIPCDMTKSSYCQHKGPGYPEAEIWRFKEENRALMRRMYGDMESTSVYRQMRSSSGHLERTEEESKNGINLGSGLMPDLFSSLEYNIRMGSGHAGLATVQSAKEPIVAGGTSATKIVDAQGRVKVKRKIVKKKLVSGPSTSTDPNAGNQQDQVKIETSTTTSTSAVFATTSESPSPSTSTSTIGPTTTIMTTQSLYDDTVTYQDMFDTTTDLPMASKDIDAAALIEIVEEFIPDTALETDDEESIDDQETEEFEEFIEDEKEPIYQGESTNACPVREEVFAPYWANNTRDNTLAILNLYPFEQYIHMETCRFENEEMLCRKGCKCEQQYRLHRLLAFDPTKECRGIFSDWFRFPSYCVCKCYNVPEVFLDHQERQSKATEETSSHIEVKKGQPKKLDPESIHNIPVVLHYEQKQALLHEMLRKDRGMEMIEEESLDDDIEDDESQNPHFFYSNAPIMEFNINGESGSVGQTPRK